MPPRTVSCNGSPPLGLASAGGLRSAAWACEAQWAQNSLNKECTLNYGRLKIVDLRYIPLLRGIGFSVKASACLGAQVP